MKHISQHIAALTTGRYKTTACQIGSNDLVKKSWENTHGKLPAGMHLAQKCGNANCHNIQHLYLSPKRDSE